MLKENSELEVQIASAGSRIVAYLINALAQILAMSVMLWAMLAPMIADANNWLNNISVVSSEAEMQNLMTEYAESIDMSLLGMGFLIFLAYAIWQIIMMSTRGQSLGKQIMNIAVIKQDGSPAGFIGVVLLREILFLFALMILGLLVGIATGSDTLSELVTYIPWLICLVMIFTHKDRRSLQDLIANTVVVQLPPKSKK